MQVQWLMLQPQLACQSFNKKKKVKNVLKSNLPQVRLGFVEWLRSTR